MITVPTVLILGAGASIPFGFPSGRDLLLLISLQREFYLSKEKPSTF